jgi:hypothetical protein
MTFGPSFCRYVSSVYIGKILYPLSKNRVSLSIYKIGVWSWASDQITELMSPNGTWFSAWDGPPIITNLWGGFGAGFYIVFEVRRACVIRKPTHFFVLCRSPICLHFLCHIATGTLCSILSTCCSCSPSTRHWTARFKSFWHETPE